MCWEAQEASEFFWARSKVALARDDRLPLSRTSSVAYVPPLQL